MLTLRGSELINEELYGDSFKEIVPWICNFLNISDNSLLSSTTEDDWGVMRLYKEYAKESFSISEDIELTKGCVAGCSVIFIHEEFGFSVWFREEDLFKIGNELKKFN